jgi:hypothetical protein
MALLRIEPKLDDKSGNYFLEIYWPHDADVPFVTTQPRYKTAAVAETDVIAIIAAAASTPRKAEP